MGKKIALASKMYKSDWERCLLPELEARVVLDQSVREKFFDLAEAAGDWD